MKTWLIERWTDQARFIATIRWFMVIVGGLFAVDAIPTGYPGLGPKLSFILNAFAVGMNAGDKTPEIVKQVTADATGIPPEKQV